MERQTNLAANTTADLSGLQGFTLPEMMVTLAVASILLTAALPSFTAFVRNNRLSGQASSLLYSLNFARSEAIKRDAANGILVCASANGQTCGGSWSQGWIVWDPVGLKALQSMPALSGSNTLTSTATTLTFASNGSASAPLSFNFCDSRGPSYARELEVDSLGRSEASQVPGLTVNGAPLTVCP